jgi:hypothetical protein
VLSDRHEAIKQFCIEMGIEHYFCITHILRNIGNRHHYLYLIKRLLKLYRQEDVYDCLQYINSEIDTSSMTSDEVQTLQKVGLTLIDSCIVIDDTTDLFSKCCQAFRTDLRIPPSTSSLETVHGHINDKKARNSTLVHQFEVLIDFVTNRTSNIEKRIKLKFERRFNAFQRRSTLPMSVINEEIALYQSTIDDCKCSETHLIKKLYKRDVPCRQLMQLGAPLPDLNVPKIYAIHLPKFHHSITIKFIRDDHKPYFRVRNKNIVPDSSLTEKERGTENRIAYMSTYIRKNLLAVIKKSLHDDAIPIFEDLFMTQKLIARFH